MNRPMLKPCPLCGSRYVGYYQPEVFPRGWVVYCAPCGCEARSSRGPVTVEQAAALWNTRHAEPKPGEGEQLLRKMLAINYTGAAALYTDDGELQDGRAWPAIDFKRDSAEEIERKMRIRAVPDCVKEIDRKMRAPVTKSCTCRACDSADPKTGLFGRLFVTCAKCGNKRCPHATDHRLECTKSNDPGQKGSAYE